LGYLAPASRQRSNVRLTELQRVQTRAAINGYELTNLNLHLIDWLELLYDMELAGFDFNAMLGLDGLQVPLGARFMNCDIKVDNRV
jgi:hypothetical protein